METQEPFSPTPSSSSSIHSENSIEIDNEIQNKKQEYCICKGEDDGRFMIQCDYCEEWYHGRCIGLSKTEGNALSEYKCPICCGISTDSIKSNLENIFSHFPHCKDMLASSKRKYAQEEDSSDSSEMEQESNEEEEEPVESKKRMKIIQVKPPPPSTRDKFKTNKMALAKLVSKRSSITVKSVDQSRALARKGFEKLFSDILNELKDLPNKNMEFKDPNVISTLVEQEMFDAHANVKSDGSLECGEAYKNKYRSLYFNLKDKKNIKLRQQVLSGTLLPNQLVRLSSQELGTEDLKAAMESIQQSSLKTVFKPLNESLTTVVESFNDPSSKGYRRDPSLSIQEEGDSKPSLVMDSTTLKNQQESAKPIIKPIVKAESTASLKIKKQLSNTTPMLNKKPKPKTESLDAILSRMQNTVIKPAIESFEAYHSLANHSSHGHRSNTDISSSLVKKDPLEQQQDVREPLSSEIVWTGQVNMPMEGKFNATATQVGGKWYGNSRKWEELLPVTLTVEGRIPVDRASSYISDQSKTKQVVVIEFTASAEQDAVGFNALFEYFSSRDRYGVFPHRHLYSGVKDMYLIPLKNGDAFPDFLIRSGAYSSDNLIWQNSNTLLAVLILIPTNGLSTKKPIKVDSVNPSASFSTHSYISNINNPTPNPNFVVPPIGPPSSQQPMSGLLGLLPTTPSLLQQSFQPLSQSFQQVQQPYQQSHLQTHSQQVQQPLDVNLLFAQLQQTGVLPRSQ